VIRWLLAGGIFLSGLIPGWSQERPLKTDDAELLGVGRIQLGFGVEFLQGKRYPISGLEGDLTRLGVTHLHFGIGRYAEFQLSGVIQDFLAVTNRYEPIITPDFAGNATSDVGDLVLATKIRFAEEALIRPGLALKFGIQLPNASNESGLGKDTTDFFANLLVSKRFGKAHVFGTLGMAILGSPVEATVQSDQWTYGLGTIIPIHPKLSLLGEIHGRNGPKLPDLPSQAEVRFGVQIRAAGLSWDLAGTAGLREYDHDSGIVLGLTYEFQAFDRSKKPKTIP
jgi:hypothetical protein